MTPNEATESSLDHVNAFFAAAPPAVLALERARQIATHVGRCAPCAELLAEHHEHRELLLDVLQTEGDKPPEASDVDPVAAAQQELELWARRVLEQASPEVKAGLERLPAPSERALAELRTLPSLPPRLVPNRASHGGGDARPAITGAAFSRAPRHLAIGGELEGRRQSNSKHVFGNPYRGAGRHANRAWSQRLGHHRGFGDSRSDGFASSCSGRVLINERTSGVRSGCSFRASARGACSTKCHSRRSLSAALPASRADQLDKRADDALELLNEHSVRTSDVSARLRNFQTGERLARRAKRRMIPRAPIVAAAVHTFGNVERNRHATAPQLARKSRSFSSMRRDTGRNCRSTSKITG
jgi:hypothetical protein